MFQILQVVQIVAPYCGLLAGACALAATSRTALTGGESYPSRAPIESVLVGQERGRWLTLEKGTLLMTELVIEAEVLKGSGDASPSAYLVPYVAGEVAGPPLDAARTESLAVIRFEPGDFEARFPMAHALVTESAGLDAGLIDGVFDRRSCEVLRADAYDLAPHVRHFLVERWGVQEDALMLFDAGASPMTQKVAVLLSSTGLGLLAAAVLALLQRRARRRSRLRQAW